jgi:hypothetical protein
MTASASTETLKEQHFILMSAKSQEVKFALIASITNQGQDFAD